MKKNILLLGGFGFIGTNILAYIDAHHSAHYQVIVFDKFPSHQKGLQFASVAKVYSGDFTDTLLVEQIFDECQIDLVLHSLSTTVPATSQNIRFDIESNVIPTIELLQTMVRHQVLDIVYLSSGGAIYGNTISQEEHRETDLAYPISSYGIVKLTIEKYLHQFSALNGVNALILRLSNPYGKYHYNEKQGVVNVASRAAIGNKDFFVWGDGDSKKDYILIDDFCEILFQLLQQKIQTDIINVGSSQLVSVNEILHTIKQHITTFAWRYKERASTDVEHFELDTTKLLARIGSWKFTPLEQGIGQTINWIKEQ